MGGSKDERKYNGRIKRNESTMRGSKGTKEQWEDQKKERTMGGSKRTKERIMRGSKGTKETMGGQNRTKRTMG